MDNADRIVPEDPTKTRALRDALKQKFLTEDNPWAVFYDLHHFKSNLLGIQAAFPAGSLHTLAVKACPLLELLKIGVGHGFGLECASLAELVQALSICPPSKIFFDSPAKTMNELKFALKQGVNINVDNFQELDRIKDILAEETHSQSDSKEEARVIGLRINPQIGSGSIASSSTATKTSKFGVPIDEKTNILSVYNLYPWLTSIHVHIGSHGCPFNLLSDGIQCVVELAQQINLGRKLKGLNPVQVIDIGGGMPANYDDDTPLDFRAYATVLKDNIPQLWGNDFRIATEFGRCVFSKPGWLASKVEYTKVSGGVPSSCVHFGADMLLRTAYLPNTWTHRISVYSRSGDWKQTKDTDTKQNIAGPLCFSGDVIAMNRPLPIIEVDDYLVLHDAGAYTLSMWSHYNSRQSPTVYSYEQDQNQLKWTILRNRDSIEEVLQFWKQ